MEYESDVSTDDDFGIDPERDPSSFYLVGKLASDLPHEDSQPSAALYRAVCDGDVATARSLFENGHNPNLPYYYIPKKKLVNYCQYDVGVSIEDERGMFQYPLHRAILLNNVELVELLLDHGGDPNVIDGRSNTPLTTLLKTKKSIDSMIVEKLILSGADKNAALCLACYGESEYAAAAEIKWLVVKTLLRHGADLRKLLNRTGRPFIHVVTKCGRGESDGFAYEILHEFLNTKLETSLLNKATERLIFSVRLPSIQALRTLVILIQVGVQVDFEVHETYRLYRCDGNGATPVQVLLEMLDFRLTNIVQQSKCCEGDSAMLCFEFSKVWALLKAGARLRLKDANISEKLVNMELTLNTIYDKTERATQGTWSVRRRSTVLGHLQHCKDVLTSMGNASHRSLFELCVLAVRRILGTYPGPKVARLDVPVFCQDAVLLKDFESFLNKTEQCLHLANAGSPPPSDYSVDSESGEEFLFHGDSDDNSNDDEDNWFWYICLKNNATVVESFILNVSGTCGVK